MYMFIDRRRQGEGFKTGWQQALPKFNSLLISDKSWIITACPKYLNSAAFSKGLHPRTLRFFPAYALHTGVCIVIGSQAGKWSNS
jgi:hypothetical protein